MKKYVTLAAAALVICTASANEKFNASTVSSATQQVAEATAAAASVASTVENQKNGTTTTMTATEAGKGAGTALLALYNQYKADGKFDYKNVTNYTQTITLLNDCAQLPSNVKNTTYLKEFGQGLMASAGGLVTNDNVSSITSSLTELAQQYADKASSATSTVSEKLSTTAAAANSLSTLLASLGK